MVLRALRWISAVSLLIVCAVAPAAAQSPSDGGTQTISGNGYRYQVPASWQQLPASMQTRLGDQMVIEDGESLSPDGTLHAHVETAVGFGVTPDHLADALGAFLGVGRGGGDSSGMPSITSLAGPDPAQVSNADSAMSGAVSYTDSNGATRVLAARMAVRGPTTYVLALDVTQDFYKSDPTFATIMNSFQLP